jgi:hypothetical protein
MYTEGHRERRGTAGTYTGLEEEGGFVLSLEDRTLDDPVVLVSTVAHELAHARLLGEGRLTSNEEDHELLTDLFTVYDGLGVFTANAAFRFGQWQYGGWHGWSAERHGYLSEPMIGHALAVYAWLRQEKSPEWDQHLETNCRVFMKKSLKYLEHVGGPTLGRAANSPEPS